MSLLENLVKVGGLEAEKYLRFHYYDAKDKKIQRAMIKGLAHGVSEESKHFLSDLLKDKNIDRHLRMEAATSLIGYENTSDLILDQLVGENNDEMIIGLVESLSQQGLEGSKEFLDHLMNDPNVNHELKMHSISSIEMDNVENFDHVMAVIQGEHSDELRNEAIDKLYDLDEDLNLDYSEALTKMLKDEKSADVRKNIYDALDMNDNLDFNATQEQVVRESDDAVFMQGVSVLIHDLKLNGKSLDAIDPEIVGRIKKLAEDPKNKQAIKYLPLF